MASPLTSQAGSGVPPFSPPEDAVAAPQLAILDFFFPGFSGISGVMLKYLGIDLNVYIPLLLLFAALTFAWDHVRDYFWSLLSDYFMSTVEIRVDDEIYNIVMAWVANQKFAKSSRRFVVNTNLSSRSWYMWRSYDDDDDDTDQDGEGGKSAKRQKSLSYTPSFGTHTFWYRGRLLLFQRTQNREQGGYVPASEREEISISCFGRSPWVLKELLLEARAEYIQKDVKNTLIYRGTCKGISSEPTWQRSLSRASRPLSTVILRESKKQLLLDDIGDYLNPATRRWYSNRGIPYRRGYLLYGPPGTGKSSLSLALAGHFNMRIYIVSLSSPSSSEENLSNLFAELPRRCIVLLEDIDTAGLSNTRETPPPPKPEEDEKSTTVPQPNKPNATEPPLGRLSLSGLLNILDGVASQEGRVLIMTTNHLEKLDKALIRPGRVDMTIEFGRADCEMTASIFTAIYTKLEADVVPTDQARSAADPATASPDVKRREEEQTAEEKKAAEEKLRKEKADREEVAALAQEFAAAVPPEEFSPAEIQGYLLRHKRSPKDAVANISEWVIETRRQKKENSQAQAEKATFVRKEENPEEANEASGSKPEGESGESAKGGDSSADAATVPAPVAVPGSGTGSDTPSSRDSATPEPHTPADSTSPILASAKTDEVPNEGIAIQV
ncbi:related to BCS1 protein precursor [Cephalotrichum gorgonifer]|uniref:Related to BCS1 protein n=1 Tax=Cephalotrichum gorgonifer TaxID=2041049 RepID=A0AAE8N0A3_9PEZI|nr:related to BCS1 protein precursor [Cephalotrichum gorgonifer]